MDVYRELGVRPFINAGGWTYTRYGGSIMPAEVVAAMGEASRQFVNIFELQLKMGEAIARMTHNEAAIVSCGAASGILLAVAACIAGTDAALAARLPETQGMRNQVIMRRYQLGTEADAMVRAAGGQIVPVGDLRPNGPASDLLAAINDQTAAILLVAFEGEGETEMEAIVAGARARGVPVLMDGACAVPPAENLWQYTRDMGVDAFITSGGKGMRGPQASGLVLGTKKMVEACRFHGSPNTRIGRGMKVGKEEFAGLYVALKLFLERDFEKERVEQVRQIGVIKAALGDVAGLQFGGTKRTELQVGFAAERFGFSAEQAAQSLLAGEPAILLLGREGRLVVRAGALQAGEEVVVAEKLRELFQVAGLR